MNATASMAYPITHSFQLSSECQGLPCWLQAFSHPGGRARWHSLSSEGQKRKYDHLWCNSCLALQGLGLTVLSLHWDYNWTYDTTTCRVITWVIYFPVLSRGLSFSLWCFFICQQKVHAGAKSFKCPSVQLTTCLCVSVYVSGMEKGPVLRFWTHWSQSCCWRKAQTRSHSQGVCVKLWGYKLHIVVTLTGSWPCPVFLSQ